jgi:hypothetical protein
VSAQWKGRGEIDRATIKAATPYRAGRSQGAKQTTVNPVANTVARSRNDDELKTIREFYGELVSKQTAFLDRSRPIVGAKLPR